MELSFCLFDVKIIASFIVKTQNAPKVLFTDEFDLPIMEVRKGFIFCCDDKTFLSKLLAKLIPIQQGEAEPEAINPLEWDGTTPWEETKKQINESFGVNL